MPGSDLSVRYANKMAKYLLLEAITSSLSVWYLMHESHSIVYRILHRTRLCGKESVRWGIWLVVKWFAQGHLANSIQSRAQDPIVSPSHSAFGNIYWLQPLQLHLHPSSPPASPLAAKFSRAFWSASEWKDFKTQTLSFILCGFLPCWRRCEHTGEKVQSERQHAARAIRNDEASSPECSVFPAFVFGKSHINKSEEWILTMSVWLPVAPHGRWNPNDILAAWSNLWYVLSYKCHLSSRHRVSHDTLRVPHQSWFFLDWLVTTVNPRKAS